MKYLYAAAANSLALALLPLLLAQGRRARRSTPRLPEAAGARQGLISAPQETCAEPPLRLLAIGESPVAGVGVTHQEHAVTYRFAQALAQHSARAVQWQALGMNGATAAQARHTLLPRVAGQFDIVLLAFGVNDVSQFHSMRHYRQALSALAAALAQRCQPRLLLVSGAPPVQYLSALPQPLRAILGLKAAALNAVSMEVAAHGGWLHAPIAFDVQDPALLASDGYHPSALGAQLWGEELARLAWGAWHGASHAPYVFNNPRKHVS
ncbi:SGNH/GDSL hydrolase family protein [Massilia sp. W12]|uniref:SGNH/GDSL hydrolase family protein n=1 Tax=Massilia sp. W12 TaxID=3126507 RepID=UPI0030D561C9